MTFMKDRIDRIKIFYKRNKRLPSYSEMLKIFNLSSKNAIYKLVHKWIAEGFLKKDNKRLMPANKFFELPFLGIIKAGYPILSEEEKEYLTLDDYLIENPLTSFLLKVSGDSLIGAGIFDGDVVIVEKKKEAHSGAIVLAQIDREWTLKILRRANGKTYLMSANPKYPPFYPKQELQIFGVVKGMVRKITN